jgi:hypothetical protein
MSLLSDAMTPCVFMNETTVSDGRGGNMTTWVPGAEFEAGFELQNSLNEAVAQAQGVKGVYRVTTSRDTRLEYHRVFKRLSDNRLFRVESKDDSSTPTSAGLDMRVVRADEWELPVNG